MELMILYIREYFHTFILNQIKHKNHKHVISMMRSFVLVLKYNDFSNKSYYKCSSDSDKYGKIKISEIHQCNDFSNKSYYEYSSDSDEYGKMKISEIHQCSL